MKKFLISLLATLCVGFTMAGVACNKKTDDVSTPVSSESVENSNADSSSSDSSEAQPTAWHTVNFTAGEGYSYVSDVEDGDKVGEGKTLTFSVEVGGFYTGSPVVMINGKPVAHNGNGVYNVKVEEELTITVTGVRKDVSSMTGTGAMDDAFVVTRPIDLLYIAEQVNKGVYAYVTGAYILANDIDCKGETLKVIGDLNNDNAYFAGCFTCETDPESGAMVRHTISNFNIETNDTNYVGLFGAVMVDLSVQSSGLFYGVCLDNFTINASITNARDPGNLTITAGGLIGYGIGTTVYLCDATNGEINVSADEAYFSFVGGLIGYQQGVYMEEFDAHFPSEIAYSAVDVDVNILKGAALYAGGISGFLTTNYPFAPAYISNSYSNGAVSGAIRSGGIAGGLGQYTSVSNCYATGDVVAKATQSAVSAGDALEYCTAYAGGIVGFAENDSIVNDSFAANTTYAQALSGAAYQVTAPIIGGGYDAAQALASSEKYVEFNCYSGVALADVRDTAEKLNWLNINWKFHDDKYPTINYETTENSVTTTITRHYVTKNANGEMEPLEVNGNSTLTMNYLNSASDAYVTIGEAFATGTLPLYYTADNGYLSYGYYFDEACTMKVPFAYLATNNVVMYVGFADPTPIVGEYTLLVDNAKKVTLELTKGGNAIYTDGYDTLTTNYLYNGETALIEAARLSRYYLGEVIVEDDTADAYFDINRYSFFDYKVTITEDGLLLADNVYFTTDAPLVAAKTAFRGEYYSGDVYYTFYGAKGYLEGGELGYAEFTYTINGENLALTYTDGTTASVAIASLSTYDAFKGTWTKSATVNKTYVFDGAGNWTYAYVGYTRNGYNADETILERANGTYTVSADGKTLTMNNGDTASFNSDGALVIVGDKTQTYYKEHSYLGKWVDKQNGATIVFNGINESGRGTATVDYISGYSFEVNYETSETDGYVAMYTENGVIFGYFTYVLNYHALSAVLYDPMNADTGYTAYTLFVVDDYAGEWISNDATFETIDFNGEGFYGSINYVNMSGVITVNGNDAEVKYTLSDSTLSGTFVYDGVQYTLNYDEDEKIVTITLDGASVQLERKDEFANKVFVDKDGNRYLFDGKSNLTSGGTLTVNGAVYGYRQIDGAYSVYENDVIIGSIVATQSAYTLTLNDTPRQLYVANELMGDWAIGGQFALFSIGATTTENKVLATFKGHKVVMTYLDSTTLTFSYKDAGMPITYYVFLFDEDTIIISEYASYLLGEYAVCTRANELYGSWSWNKDPELFVEFDGVSSPYVNGVARLRRRDSSTYYYYSMNEDGIVMWSQELLGSSDGVKRTLYYKISFTDDLTNADSYVNGDRALVRTEVDGLYLTKATDEKGVTYVFDGMNIGGEYGTLSASNGKTYRYKVTAYNTNNTAEITLIDENGVEYTAILDYNDNQNIKIMITKAE